MKSLLRFVSGSKPLNTRRQEYIDGLPTGETGFQATDAVPKSLRSPRDEPQNSSLPRPPSPMGERGLYFLCRPNVDTFVQTMNSQDG